MKTAQHIVTVFSPYGSPIILVLKHQIFTKFDGVTPFGGAKYSLGKKNRDFLPISRYILQTMEDIAIVNMEGE